MGIKFMSYNFLGNFTGNLLRIQFKNASEPILLQNLQIHETAQTYKRERTLEPIHNDQHPKHKLKLVDDTLQTEFGRSFGKYKVVFPIVKKIPSSLRKVPCSIPCPSYYKTGVPGRTSISKPEKKSIEQIKRLKEACELSRYILEMTKKEAKVGITTDQLDGYAHNLITKHGAYPSPLNYRNFPKSICTSINNVACHGIPDERKLEDGDIMNIDVTVFYNGMHGDCSDTIPVGSVDNLGQELIDITKRCLYKGISVCKPNIEFSNIGKAIEEMAVEEGYSVVSCFAGHGIGEYFHSVPDIYHVDNDLPGIMEAGMSFTIEPVISQGQSEVEIHEDGWTALTIDNSRTAQFEHTILITENGAEILTK